MPVRKLFEEIIDVPGIRCQERWIGQDGTRLVFHVVTKKFWSSPEHRIQVWDIGKVKEALTKTV